MRRRQPARCVGQPHGERQRIVIGMSALVGMRHHDLGLVALEHFRKDGDEDRERHDQLAVRQVELDQRVIGELQRLQSSQLVPARRVLA